MGLTALPEEALELSGLAALLLGRNELTTIPRNLESHFPNLIYLDLSNNSQLATPSLPSSLGDLDSLRLVDMTGNYYSSSSESESIETLSDFAHQLVVLGVRRRRKGGDGDVEDLGSVGYAKRTGMAFHGDIQVVEVSKDEGKDETEEDEELVSPSSVSWTTEEGEGESLTAGTGKTKSKQRQRRSEFQDDIDVEVKTFLACLEVCEGADEELKSEFQRTCLYFLPYLAFMIFE
jgi:hypothetical protein